MTKEKIENSLKETINCKILIIGSGAGGLAAATYGARGMSEKNEVHCIMGSLPGGQLTTTDKVYNFIGYREIDGYEVMNQCIQQSEDAGAILHYEWAQKILTNVDNSNLHYVYTENKIYISPVVIIATGANHVKLPVKNEEKFRNKGIYYCATCDGPLFKKQKVMVVGGGNTALTEALFLSTICSEVILVHRRNEFRGEPFLVESVKNSKNIILELSYEVNEILYNNIDPIYNQDKLYGIKIINNQTQEEKVYYLNALFVAIGFSPNTEILNGTNILVEDGYLITNPANMETNIKGIYGVGDVTDKIYRQAVTAAGDGAKAAINALKYINNKGNFVKND